MIRATIAGGVALAALTPALANHSWENLHWARSGTEVTLPLRTVITSVWTKSVTDARADWETSPRIALVNATAPATVSPKQCSPVAGEVVVCNYTYGRRGWLGIATVWTSAGHIGQATTKLNDSYFNLPQYNKPEWRALVACQEIGHDFGLGHQDENHSNANLGTCMDYTNQPLGGGTYGSLKNIAPNAHDDEQLETIYGHTDAASTNFGVREVGKAAAPGLSREGAGDSPAEWGRAISRDGEGRPDVYVKDFGGSRRMYTHVFWAIGEGPNGKHHDEH